MGAYLSTPVVDKETDGGVGGTVQWGVSSMQGWRRTMEDAHIAATDIGGDQQLHLFGVFDGHGGAEVAKFCQKHLVRELTRLQRYHQGDIGRSLTEVFHRMDDMLRDEQYSGELDRLRRGRSAPTAGALPAKHGEPAGEGEAVTQEILKRLMELRQMVSAGQQPDLGAAAAAGPPDPAADPAPLNTEEALRAANGLSPDSSIMQPLPIGNGMDTSPAPAPECHEDVLPEHRIHAGCTAVVAVLKGRDLYVANAGDSRAVLSRGGTAEALSEDHKPAQDSERARITTAGGFVSDVGGVSRVNGNLNLSRAIGDLKYKSNRDLGPAQQIITAEPDVRHVELAGGDDFVLLACDGVWDVMTNQQAVDFVAERLSRGMPPTDTANELLDACLAKDPKEARGIGCDNMTAAIIILKH